MRKLIGIAMVFLVLLPVGSALGQAIPWEIKYLGNMPPDAWGSCGVWNGASMQWILLTGDPALGAVVDDAAAIDGKAYQVNDNSGIDSLIWRSEPSMNIDSALGATIVGRVKTVSDTNNTGNIGMQGSGLASAFHWGGPNGDILEPYRGGSATVPGDGEYHIIRLAAFGSSDAKPVPYSESFTYPDRNLNGVAGFNGTATTEIAIVSNAVQVIGNGSETTAGVRVHAEPDVEGKIHITCNLKLITGGDIWCTSLKVYDSAGRWMAGWQAHGYADATNFGSVKGRAEGISTGLRNLQNDADGSALEMIIDVRANTCEYIVDGFSLGTLTCPPFGVGGNNVERLEFTRFNDTRPGNPVMQWDDLAMNGTAVSGRTIRLYLDENPVPKVEILNASRIDGEISSSDRFRMGVYDVAGLQDVYFDWVVGSAAGAFAPGEEEGYIGHSLLIDPSVVTTIADAKKAPEHAQVELPEVSVTSILKSTDEYSAVLPVGFFVADYANVGSELEPVYKAYQGIHVVYNPDYGVGFYQGELVKISGTCETINGERVVVANYVEEVQKMAPALGPQAINNKASGGGAFGMQPALVGDVSRLTGMPAYDESFTYADGALAGKGLWVGNPSLGIGVSGNQLAINSPGPAKSATQNGPWGDCGTDMISVKIDAKAGSGLSNFWTLSVLDEAGLSFGYWMGSGTFVRGRMASGEYTPELNLGTGWKTIEIKIYPSMDATEFLADGVRLGADVFDHSITGCGNAVGSIRLDRLEGDTTNQVLLDDLQVLPGAATDTGLNNVGIHTTIFGRVTEVISDPVNAWNSYFYVDDGTGLRDGTGNVGIRCRPCSADFFETSMPTTTGDFVRVIGSMGVKNVNGNIVRYFYSWSFKSY